MTAVSILFCSSAQARTYYVRVGGSNSASGLSWSTAWATPSYTNGRIAAGDTVLFGAGRWLNSQIVAPSGGASSRRTVYACSTLTVATKNSAIISGAEPVTNWTAHSGNIWRAPWSGWRRPPGRTRPARHGPRRAVRAADEPPLALWRRRLRAAGRRRGVERSRRSPSLCPSS